MKFSKSPLFDDLVLISLAIVGGFFFVYGNTLLLIDRSSALGITLFSIGFVLIFIMITVGLKQYEKNLGRTIYKIKPNERRFIHLLFFSAWAFLSSFVLMVMLKVALPANEFELYTGLGHPLGLLLTILIYTGTIGLALAAVLMYIVSYINARKQKGSRRPGESVCASCKRVINRTRLDLRCPYCGDIFLL